MASISSPAGSRDLCDGVIWGNLPEPLTENILSRLPISILAKLRLVCKSWNTLIVSPDFTELRSRNKKDEIWFLMGWKPQKSIVVYDPSLRHWHDMRVHSVTAGDSHILGTSGGLIFAVSYFKCSSGGNETEGHYDYEDFQFTVGNPLTGTWRKIPGNSSVMDIYMAGMKHNKDSNSYAILLCGSCARGRPYMATEIYDSATESWKDGEDFVLPESDMLEVPQTEAVCVNGLFFCLLDETVHAYDLQRGNWIPLSAKIPPSHTFISLFSCCCTLLMITENRPVSLRAGDTCLPFRIWELEQASMKMVEKEMDHVLWSNSMLDPQCSGDYFVFGQGEWLCFWTLEEDLRAYAYDWSEKQWHQLSRSDFLEDLDLLDNLCGMAYQPSFNTTA